MGQLTVREISTMATEVTKNTSANPHPENPTLSEWEEMCMGKVLMADYLSCVGIPVRCAKFPNATLDGKQYSERFQKIAAERGVTVKGDLNDIFIRSCTGNLLWSIEFLAANIEDVKEYFLARIKAEMFGGN